MGERSKKAIDRVDMGIYIASQAEEVQRWPL